MGENAQKRTRSKSKSTYSFSQQLNVRGLAHLYNRKFSNF